MLTDLAAKCRPAWPLATACYLALQGAAIMVLHEIYKRKSQAMNRQGQTVLGLVGSALGPQYCALLQHFSNSRSKYGNFIISNFRGESK